MSFLAAVLILISVTSQPEWLTIQTEHAIVHYQQSDSLAVENMVEIIEPSIERIANDLQLTHIPPIKIIVAPDRNAYNELSPDRKPPGWSVGWANPRTGQIALLSENGARMEGRDLVMSQIFVHELAHLLLDAKLQGRDIPKWLEEGYAKTAAREWSLGTSTTLTWAVVRGRLIPLDEIVHRFPKGTSRVHLAYAQSQSFVAYLFHKYGPEGFGYFLDLLARDMPMDRALKQAFGGDLRTIEAQWNNYLQVHHTWLGLFVSRRWVWALMSLLFLVAVAVSWRRRKKKLRRMELEDMIHDLDYEEYAKPKRRKKGNGKPTIH